MKGYDEMTEIKVIKNLVNPSKYSIKCPYTMTPKYITIHNTSNNAPAKNEVSYMIGNNNQVSFHYAIDNKEVIQGIPDNRNAWHCGDGIGNGNRASIGLEICYSTKKDGNEYRDAEELTVKFTAQLLKKYGLTVDKVRTHKSWTEIGVKKGYSSWVKNCPHRILDEGRWSSFIKRVQVELDKLNNKVVTVSDNKAAYHSSLPLSKKIEALTTINVYNSESFTEKTKTLKAFKKGDVITVKEVIKNKSGIYRFKIENGYISANKAYSKVHIKPDPRKIIGTVTTLINDLNYYSKPQWNNPKGTLSKNTILNIVAKVKVEGSYQYETISGTYVTASPSFVRFKAK